MNNNIQQIVNCQQRIDNLAEHILRAKLSTQPNKAQIQRMQQQLDQAIQSMNQLKTQNPNWQYTLSNIVKLN